MACQSLGFGVSESASLGEPYCRRWPRPAAAAAAAGMSRDPALRLNTMIILGGDRAKTFFLPNILPAPGPGPATGGDSNRKPRQWLRPRPGPPPAPYWMA